MADGNPSRVGQVNESGAVDALFLKQFGGEVLTMFDASNVTQGRVMERNIQNGKTAQFPLIGSVGSGYHTPGSEITGQTVPHAEQTIELEGLLYSDIFLDNIDELQNHYDVRQPYASEMGAELATQFDDHNFRSIIKSARAASPLSDPKANPGEVIYSSSMASDSKVLRDTAFTAAKTFDEKNVPAMERYWALAPAQYYILIQRNDIMNRELGGRGSLADAELPELANFKILKSNQIPMSDDSSNSDLLSKYQINASATKGAFWYKRAAGVLKLRSMSMETNWDFRRQGYLSLAKMAVGHDKLRQDCAIEMQAVASGSVVGSPASKTGVISY